MPLWIREHGDAKPAFPLKKKLKAKASSVALLAGAVAVTAPHYPIWHHG